MLPEVPLIGGPMMGLWRNKSCVVLDSDSLSLYSLGSKLNQLILRELALSVTQISTENGGQDSGIFGSLSPHTPFALQTAWGMSVT